MKLATTNLGRSSSVRSINSHLPFFGTKVVPTFVYTRVDRLPLPFGLLGLSKDLSRHLTGETTPPPRLGPPRPGPVIPEWHPKSTRGRRMKETIPEGSVDKETGRTTGTFGDTNLMDLIKTKGLVWYDYPHEWLRLLGPGLLDLVRTLPNHRSPSPRPP